MTSGKQCFVFESEDKTTVVKFISSKRFMKPSFLNQLLNDKTQKTKLLLDKELSSYHLALTHLKEQSQIIGLKLGKCSDLPFLTITDPYGFRRKIDLNKAEFIIQPKAIPLNQLIAHKALNSDKLEAIYNLLHLRFDLNIYDLDPRIHRNMGFFNQKPFFIDIGSFITKEVTSEDFKQKQLKKIIDYNARYLDNRRKLAL
jgi:hypothetical protein